MQVLLVESLVLDLSAMIISSLALALLLFPVSTSGEVGVCRKIYNTSTGSLQSGNYPNHYDDYTECEYFIRPVLDHAYILKLVPEDFDLEGGYDILEVREDGPHGTYVGHFTGPIMPILFGKGFWMRFTSDYSNTKKGFKFTWTVVMDGIRLVNGTGSLEGRVEIFHAGKWGTICDDSWEPAEAYITCKMLGFLDPSAQHFTQAHFGRGVDPIWLDNTRCFNNMTSLAECRTDGWGTHNCNHGEDSGVRCTVAAETIKRLVGKSNSFPKGCSLQFDTTSGSFTSPQYPLYPNFARCQYIITPRKSATQLAQLSFSSFDLQEGFDFLEIREDGPTGVFLGRFTGNRLPPILYAKSLWMYFTSDDSIGHQGFKVSWEQSSNGVRLRNGTRFNEGRVEIYRQGEWGTICDDSWDTNEVTVVCYMLGYRENEKINGTVLKGGEFGPGPGKILMDDMSCTGMEENIHECSFSDSHNCNHFEDAGLRCNSKTYLSPANGSFVERQDISDVVSISCDSMRLKVSVNLTDLSKIYPELTSKMYLTLATPDCVGQRDSDAIVFNNDITACGMTATENRNNVVYRNRLISHENDTSESNVTLGQPAFIIPLECSLSKTVQLSKVIKVYKKKTRGKTVHGYGNFTGELNLYKDPGFTQQLRDYPVYVEVGEEMFVETRIMTNDKHLKVVLYDCTATADPNSTKADTYKLISNRCPRDRTTRLLPSPRNSSTRFLFKSFQFVEDKEEVYLKCSLLVCNVSDNSSRCMVNCSHTRRSRRAAEYNRHFIEVIQGPIILESKSVHQKETNIHLGGIIAACAVMALVVLVVVLAIVARKKKKVVSWYINRVYNDYDNHTDEDMMIPMESTPVH